LPVFFGVGCALLKIFCSWRMLEDSQCYADWPPYTLVSSNIPFLGYDLWVPMFRCLIVCWFGETIHFVFVARQTGRGHLFHSKASWLFPVLYVLVIGEVDPLTPTKEPGAGACTSHSKAGLPRWLRVLWSLCCVLFQSHCV
jgi:hypothetical protein